MVVCSINPRFAQTVSQFAPACFHKKGLTTYLFVMKPDGSVTSRWAPDVDVIRQVWDKKQAALFQPAIVEYFWVCLKVSFTIRTTFGRSSIFAEVIESAGRQRRLVIAHAALADVRLAGPAGYSIAGATTVLTLSFAHWFHRHRGPNRRREHYFTVAGAGFANLAASIATFGWISFSSMVDLPSVHVITILYGSFTPATSR